MVKMGLSRAGILVLVLSTVFGGTGYCAGPAGAGIRDLDFRVNGTNISNITVPYEYRQPPDPVRVEVTVASSLLPGPKGEMQAGPRSIGFDLSFLLVSLGIVLAGVAALVGYGRIRKPPEDPDDDPGNNDL